MASIIRGLFGCSVIYHKKNADQKKKANSWLETEVRLHLPLLPIVLLIP